LVLKRKIYLALKNTTIDVFFKMAVYDKKITTKGTKDWEGTKEKSFNHRETEKRRT
jgi:hypothetical protein